MEERIEIKHVAIIMDGNGRWAKKQNKPRVFGHKEGVNRVRDILNEAKEIGVKYLSIYAFSTENWKRPKAEVFALMTMFVEYLKKEREDMNEKGVRIVFSGRREGLSDKVLKSMDESVEYLAMNDKIVFNICFNYGGRAEIVDGINRIIKDGVERIDEESFKNYLYNSEIPDPDLVIRTSGEFRISNFLLWEIAYSEFYISDKFWPEFTRDDFREAVYSLKNRERRFGGV